MESLRELVSGLFSKDNNAAYACLKRLLDESSASGAVYPYFDTFAEMLGSDNSYLRTRGMFLIAANAPWDVDNQIDEILPAYLALIEDDKPITARQCIQTLPDLARHKPDLAPQIRLALLGAKPGKYKPTMQPLVQKDIAQALQRIQG